MHKITVLRSTWSAAFAAKRFFLGDDGGIKSEDYRWGREGRAEVRLVQRIEDLAMLLLELEGDPTALIVPATPNPDLEITNRRLKGEGAGLIDYDRSWIVIDLDKMPVRGGIAGKTYEEIKAGLLALREKQIPPPFNKARCIAQFSSSAFVAGKLGVHLWFLCDRVFSNASARAYFREQQKTFQYLDPAIYVGNQPHYIARPVFDPDHLDPFKGLPRLYDLEGSDLILPKAIRDSAEQKKFVEESRKGRAPVPAALRCRAQNERAQRYARKILQNLANDIGNAAQGTRHETMLKRIHAAAAYVGEGYFSRETLLDAVLSGIASWGGGVSEKDRRKAEGMLDDSLSRVGGASGISGEKTLKGGGTPYAPSYAKPKEKRQPQHTADPDPLSDPLPDPVPPPLPDPLPDQSAISTSKHEEAFAEIAEARGDLVLFKILIAQWYQRTLPMQRASLCAKIAPIFSMDGVDHLEEAKVCFVQWFGKYGAQAALDGGA